MRSLQFHVIGTRVDRDGAPAFRRRGRDTSATTDGRGFTSGSTLCRANANAHERPGNGGRRAGKWVRQTRSVSPPAPGVRELGGSQRLTLRTCKRTYACAAADRGLAGGGATLLLAYLGKKPGQEMSFLIRRPNRVYGRGLARRASSSHSSRVDTNPEVRTRFGHKFSLRVSQREEEKKKSSLCISKTGM